MRYIRTYIIIIHTIHIANLLYDDYADILEYPVSLPLVDWQLVYVAFYQAIDGPPIISPPGPSVAATDGPPDQAWLS